MVSHKIILDINVDHTSHVSEGSFEEDAVNNNEGIKLLPHSDWWRLIFSRMLFDKLAFVYHKDALKSKLMARYDRSATQKETKRSIIYIMMSEFDYIVKAVTEHDGPYQDNINKSSTTTKIAKKFNTMLQTTDQAKVNANLLNIKEERHFPTHRWLALITGKKILVDQVDFFDYEKYSYEK